MSEQNGTRVSTKPRRNRQANTKKTSIQRSVNDDKEALRAYWKAQGQSWRTEPEIDEERQTCLAKLRSSAPNIEGICPFKGIKLSRADVEWLLSTHDNNHGPINWNDESQRKRKGLNLRGADLSKEDLSRLPLTNVCFGLNIIEALEFIRTDELVDANETMKAKFMSILQVQAQLQETNFEYAELQGASFENSQLQGAFLYHAQLEEANLASAQLQLSTLTYANLQGANLHKANLQGASLIGTKLRRTYLHDAQLQGANLHGAELQGANLSYAQLQSGNLSEAQLQGVNLKEASLADGNHNGPQLVDIQWGDANLAVVDWSQLFIIGDEHEANQKIDTDFEERKSASQRTSEYKTAARAYRQLTVVLRNQGLNEDAARFSYRAQVMQRKAFWYKHKFLSYLGSLFLDLLSGYGYKVGRCFIAYALVIGIFATVYHLLGTHPTWNESIVISMTAFHGRGFFPDQFHPGDPQALAAAIEALVGLLIEITLIATLTQRLFGR